MRARKATIAIVIAAVLLGAMELVARSVPEPLAPQRGIVLDPHPTRIWTPSAPDPRSGQPVNYALDETGMRVSTWRGPAEAPLILTLGDSSIFGDGVPDPSTLHAQLGRELDALGISARTHTLAVPGYSLVQTRVVLDELGWAWSPSLLVVGNLWSDCNLDAWRDEELLRRASSPLASTERLLSRSALFRRIRIGLNLALDRPATRRVTWPQPGSQGVRRVPIDRYAALLDDLLDDAARRGVGVVVLGLADWRACDAGRVTGPCSIYADVQREIALGRGVTWVSGLDAFRGSGVPSSELFGDPLHPSERGTRVLAHAVAAALSAAGWPESPLLPGPARPYTVPADEWDGVGPRMIESVQQDISIQ